MTIRALALAFALVPAAAMAGNPIDLRATPTLTGARLRIAVKQPGGVANVRRFATIHESAMHLFVVGGGLEFFAHEHPVQQPDGVFMVDLTLPRRGPYMAIVEFQPDGGTLQMVHQAFTTGAVFGRVAHPPTDTIAKIVNGMRISLDASAVKPGEAQPMTLRVEDAETGAPSTDLEPYLGAGAHLIAVSPDLTEAVHDHPQPDGRGPTVTFRPLLPRAGVFKIWVQFQRDGRVTSASFVIEIRGQGFERVSVSSTRHGLSPTRRASGPISIGRVSQ